ncbi:MAG: TetR/AcrR family transcriptional regulator [Micromonosporaceae bacterium]|nr:TetR/AcrR family transcriptional regulator [Micromonosporaceae bacterium]
MKASYSRVTLLRSRYAGKVTVPGPRRLPRAIREQQMLDAAVAAFSASGYHEASMDDIAARAGISKPMVYAYLGSKEELFLACLHREATRLIEAMVRSAAPDLAPEEQLLRGLRSFFGFVAEHRAGWRVLYRQARGPFAAELATIRSRMVEVAAGLLRRAGVPAGRDVTVLAYALVGACESLADWLVDNDDEPAGAVATRLMNFVWPGVSREASLL